MASLPALPPELIYEIFDYLQPCKPVYDTDYRQQNHLASYPSLAALTRTCRALHPIATRVLYKGYHAPLEQPIIPFIRRLKTHPDACGDLRHLNIQAEMPGWDPCNRRPEAEIMADVLQDSVLSQPCYHDLTTESLSGNELALLVSRASKLETLSVFNGGIYHDGGEDMQSVCQSLWFRLVVDAACTTTATPGRQITLNRLRTLEIILGTVSSGDLEPLFGLPCLRRLCLIGHIYRHREEDDISIQWAAPPSSSTVQDLDLVLDHAPAALVGHMIGTCKSLSRFGCYRAGYDEDDIGLWLTTIVDNLEKHVTSLADLSLPILPGGENQKRVEGLNHFNHLKSLTIPLEVLAGTPLTSMVPDDRLDLHDLLPQRLEELCLNINTVSAAGPKYANAILSLVEQSLGSDTPLRKLKVKNVNRLQDFKESALPLAFWTAEKQCKQHDFDFEYSIALDWFIGTF